MQVASVVDAARDGDEQGQSPCAVPGRSGLGLASSVEGGRFVSPGSDPEKGEGVKVETGTRRQERQGGVECAVAECPGQAL